MTAAVVVGSSSCSNSSSSRRLLTSVAIIGRENEPIYLLGDLWDGDNDSTVASPTKTIAAAAAATEADHNVDATTSTKSMKVATHPKNDNDDGETDQNVSLSPPTTNNSPPKGRGLFGRIMKKNNDDASNITSSSTTNTSTHHHQQQQLNDNIDDDDDDDPFGFFESSYSNPHHRQQHRMSLTQQLVLHASLDVFEEKASSSRTMYSGKSRSGNGGRGSASGSGGSGVRWRTPGTDSATSMYIGLLCRVEERWSVYGYLTNTGIKFLAVVEDMGCSSTSASSIDNDDEDDLFHYPSLPSWIDERSSTMESETRKMKKVFTQLHDLYVRYTMNPFSRLRSPIRSNQFDVGVLTLARSFNGISERGGVRSQNNGTPTTGGEGQKAKEEDGPSWV